jgi:acylphosphatase
MIKTVLIVYGNVQKADYRGRVIAIAKEIGITGTVQNLSNGTVRIVVEGEVGEIERFYDEIRIRNILIKVTDIKRGNDIEIIKHEYESFYKLVGEGETDERIDIALLTAESLKKLSTDIGIFVSKLDSYVVEQREQNKRMDTYIVEQREQNKDMNQRMDVHNSKLENILEKLSEK